MRWNRYEEVGHPPVHFKRINIPVRQLGLAKVVFVRTIKNGGINRRQIKILEG